MASNESLQAFARHILLGEIEFQAQCAERAAKRILAHEEHRDHIETWSAIQSLLAAAANVSKILWPQKKESGRGERLRQLLRVDERSPLSNRRIRNHFEHYDERIEDWVSSGRSAAYTDLMFGPLRGFYAQFPENIHRAYDPATQILRFRGEAINLREIMSALDEIRLKCRQVPHV